MPGELEQNADRGTLSERVDRYRLEAQRIVGAGAEHPCWELTRQASLNKNNVEERADFVKLVQGIANAHLREERVLVIGADQTNKSFQAVSNAAEFDPARVSDVLERYLSPKPVLEVFNSLQTDDGVPFILLVFAPQQPRPLVGSGGIQDGKGNNLFRKGDIWVKEGTALRIATPQDISAMVEERIQSEADSRARKQFSQFRYEIVAAQQLITTSGRRSPAADLIYGRDEDFRLYVEDLLANDDSARFSMLIELLRDLIIEGWNRVDGYSAGGLEAEKLHSQLNEHKNAQFLPAFRRLTEIGLLLIKHRAKDEWFEQVGHLIEESFVNTTRLLRLAPFDNVNAPAQDFDKYVGRGMVALESMLSARTLATYAMKRKLYEFVSILLKITVPIIGAYKELKQSLLLWPLRLSILVPQGVILLCWEKRISNSYPSFFGNWEDFLRAACQLEFILELNSYLGVGEAGQKPKQWLARYRPDTVFNYVPDHLRYELSVCRPIAEELHEAIKRGPDDWTIVFLSIEKSLFDAVLKGENEHENVLFIPKFLKYLQKYQAQQFPLRFFLQAGLWGDKLTPLLAQLDAAGQQAKSA
jgi:hypothetical protein